MYIISTTALISINETVIVQAILFLIFLFIINKIMFKPLRNSMVERERHIEKIKTDIIESEREIEKLTSHIKEKEAEVRSVAFEMNKKLEESGSLEATSILAFTREEIEEIEQKTKQEVVSWIERAKKYMKREAKALAVKIMEKVLNRNW
mmetsp:Transcript_18459/g.8603  ORF Transcript_18459/g.8603 Transcript_18459/m.8603 type:complete len:150 (+) Transcript_18459:979-1428(+)